MSAQFLLNLLNDFENRDKILGAPSILSLFRKVFKNSIILEHDCKT